MPITTSPHGLRRHFTWKTGSPPKWLVFLAPIVLNTGFGLYPVVLKLFAAGQDSNQNPNPFVFTLYRCLCTVLVLFTAAYLVEGPIHIPDLRMTLVFLSLGFLGVFLGQFTYIAGAFLIPADISTAFQPLIPVWTAVLTVVLCIEDVPSFIMLHSWTKIAGILIAAGGAVELALAGYDPDPSPSIQSGQQMMGYIFILLDTLFASLFYTLQKKLVYKAQNCKWKDYPLTQTGYVYLFGMIFEVLFCTYYLLSGRTQDFYLPQHSLPALVYAVFINSALCYFLITWSNKYLPSSVLTAFWPLQVFATVAAAYLILGDTLTYTQVLSAAAIIGGLCLVVYSNRVDERISQTGEGGIRLDSCLRHTTSNG